MVAIDPIEFRCSDHDNAISECALIGPLGAFALFENSPIARLQNPALDVAYDTGTRAICADCRPLG